MDTLTEERKEALIEFKELVSDLRRDHDDDAYLTKWLAARSFNVKKAAEMYRKSMSWRAEMGADTILTTYTPPTTLTEFYPGGFCGQDKEGRPVWIDPLGRGDIKGIIHSTRRTDVIKFIVWRLEKLYANFRDRTRDQGKLIDKCTHIIDMSGFGPKIFWKPALDLYIEVLQILEKNYPETLHKTYLINAPRVFHMGWNVLSKFIDKDTAKKFQFLGSNYSKTFLEIIDADQLPAYYGGTRTDPDGNIKCLNEVCYGGDIPKDRYLSKDDIFPEGIPREEENLGRGGTLTVGFSIPDTQYVIRYVFSVNHGNIDYGIYRQRTQDNAVFDAGKLNADARSIKDSDVIKETTTVECSKVPEDGFIFFEKPGIYYVHFKNTGRVWKKTLTYVMEVITLDSTGNVMKPQVSMVTKNEDETTQL